MNPENIPFLFQFLEVEPLNKPLEASPEKGGESNPIEDEPDSEPTKLGPWGE